VTTIAIVGAGGFEFPLRLGADFLSFESMRDAHLVLMDIDPDTLARTERHLGRVVEAHGLEARITATTDRRAALTGADVVVVCFQVGGVDAYALDIEIPRRYGIDQTVGDTLGPGGIFRGLRSMHALAPITRDMREVCPDALLLQYANPMSMNCWFTSGEGVRTVGLCHSVQHTADFLASVIGAAPGTTSFRAAGINHQSWLLDYRVGGRDALAELRTAVREYARGERDASGEVDDWYGGGREQVRTAIMELTGHFPTESSHHNSEYLPFFRRTPAETLSYIANRWDYLEQCRATHGSHELQELADELSTGRLQTSEEYAAQIVDSIITDTPRVIYGNVPNTGLITNLPDGCCVEVACLVDQNGVQPTYFGDLPAACAGVNLGSIAVQACTVEAYRTRSRDAVHAALGLDRLTSAALALGDVHRLADELLAAEAQWLPAFT
jgi:alpha-galactosidase